MATTAVAPGKTPSASPTASTPINPGKESGPEIDRYAQVTGSVPIEREIAGNTKAEVRDEFVKNQGLIESLALNGRFTAPSGRVWIKDADDKIYYSNKTIQNAEIINRVAVTSNAAWGNLEDTNFYMRGERGDFTRVSRASIGTSTVSVFASDRDLWSMDGKKLAGDKNGIYTVNVEGQDRTVAIVAPRVVREVTQREGKWFFALNQGGDELTEFTGTKSMGELRGKTPAPAPDAAPAAPAQPEPQDARAPRLRSRQGLEQALQNAADNPVLQDALSQTGTNKTSIKMVAQQIPNNTGPDLPPISVSPASRAYNQIVFGLAAGLKIEVRPDDPKAERGLGAKRDKFVISHDGKEIGSVPFAKGKADTEQQLGRLGAEIGKVLAAHPEIRPAAQPPAAGISPTNAPAATTVIQTNTPAGHNAAPLNPPATPSAPTNSAPTAASQPVKLIPAAEEIVKRGIDHYMHGRYGQAMASFEQAQQSYPKETAPQRWATLEKLRGESAATLAVRSTVAARVAEYSGVAREAYENVLATPGAAAEHKEVTARLAELNKRFPPPAGTTPAAQPAPAAAAVTAADAAKLVSEGDALAKGNQWRAAYGKYQQAEAGITKESDPKGWAKLQLAEGIAASYLARTPSESASAELWSSRAKTALNNAKGVTTADPAVLKEAEHWLKLE